MPFGGFWASFAAFSALWAWVRTLSDTQDGCTAQATVRCHLFATPIRSQICTVQAMGSIHLAFDRVGFELGCPSCSAGIHILQQHSRISDMPYPPPMVCTGRHIQLGSRAQALTQQEAVARGYQTGRCYRGQQVVSQVL
jgi:hypothetical protein